MCVIEASGESMKVRLVENSATSDAIRFCGLDSATKILVCLFLRLIFHWQRLNTSFHYLICFCVLPLLPFSIPLWSLLNTYTYICIYIYIGQVFLNQESLIENKTKKKVGVSSSRSMPECLSFSHCSFMNKHSLS